ncbi:alpha/beta-hydrolase [Trametes versicolor FP-101664 SS1]|uniref:alpha/beta-hydrolase n=1 Tax=Trametes versicolor (strain FP-101664) TaxID=717944 RepID=UPI0004624516|nr:alpha/beta-hydrolase [Trametes versicolor FP-101664 SS1]EIW59422.1 alpha/beta-hydrolase [Trametes versicolor FP-101664 SS1]
MSCPECITGSLHTGTPVGSETKVGGVSAYVTGDENASRIIVIGADVYGWTFANTRLLADEYAARGFRVVVPDFFSGWSVPLWSLDAVAPDPLPKSLFTRFVLAPAALFLLVPLILRNLPHQVATLTKITAAVRAAHPKAAVGYVGFCWGGRFAISQNALFDASVAAHPSLVKFPAELDGIKGPFSLAVAATDRGFDRAKAEKTEKILQERGLKDVEVVVYDGVHHGWTTRANLADEVQKKARNDAVEQVVGWFEKYLKPLEDKSVQASARSIPSCNDLLLP